MLKLILDFLKTDSQFCFSPFTNDHRQGRMKWKNCRLTPKLGYQLGWTVLAASRLLNTLKQNFYFI